MEVFSKLACLLCFCLSVWCTGYRNGLKSCLGLRDKKSGDIWVSLFCLEWDRPSGLNSTLPNRNDGSTIHKVGVCWRQTEKLVLWGFSRPMNSCSLRDKDFAKMVSHLRTLHLYQMTNAHKSMAEKLSGPTAVLQSHSDCWSVLRGLRNFGFLFAGAWK